MSKTTARSAHRWSRSLLDISNLLALATLGVAGFVVLRRVEQETPDHLFSLQLLGEPVIWRTSLTVLLFAAALFGVIVQLPVFFQAALHTSATVAGLLRIPLTLAQVLVSTTTGLRISTTAFFVLAAGIELGPVFIALLTLLIGTGLGSTN